MRLLYVGTMILTYPITFFVCRQVLHNFLTPFNDSGELPDIHTISHIRHLSYTFALFVPSVSIVMATGNLGAVMSLTGNVAGSMLAFVLPGLIALGAKPEMAPHYRTLKPLAWGVSPQARDDVAQKVLVALGVVIIVLGLLDSLL
jgi:hypothetical protein